MVTIHGDIEDAKLFPKNGPKGTYSHFWMSRADQSLNNTIPKICSAASFVEIRSPSFVLFPMMNPISNSKSNRPEA